MLKRTKWVAVLFLAWPGMVTASGADRVMSVEEADRGVSPGRGPPPWRPWRIDLAPARWIWLPSQRTLPNTFLLFRRELTLSGPPRRATGFVTADSRYLLTVTAGGSSGAPPPAIHAASTPIRSTSRPC